MEVVEEDRRYFFKNEFMTEDRFMLVIILSVELVM